MSRSDAAWQCSKHQKAIHYMMEKLEVSGPNALLSTSRWKQRRRHSEFLHSARWWGHRCRLGLHRKAWSPNPPQQHTVAYLVNSYSNNFPFSFGFLTCFSWLATSVLEARFLGSKAGRQGNLLKFSLVEHGQATLGSFSSKLLLMWPRTLHRCSAADPSNECEWHFYERRRPRQVERGSLVPSPIFDCLSLTFLFHGLQLNYAASQGYKVDTLCKLRSRKWSGTRKKLMVRRPFTWNKPPRTHCSQGS